MNSKKFNCISFSVFASIMIAIALVTFIFDPFFHYHAPYDWQVYELKEERYQNDGIVRHFEYDAIITGTSMAQNFKKTEMDRLFQVDTVKTTFSGGTYKEIDMNLRQAIEKNKNIRCVLRTLDVETLIAEKDLMNYDGRPEYLYDENIFNDAEYIWNKEIFMEYTVPSICYAISANVSTSFDDYSNWYKKRPSGKQLVDKEYIRPQERNLKREFTVNDQRLLTENIQQNVIALAKENPQITFYYYFPPYSIYWWDSKNQVREVEFFLEAEKMAAEMIVECDNIHLFSFYGVPELVCDLDNYSDITHYGEFVNSQILEWMKDDKYRITSENLEQYYSEIYDFYTTYDYDGLFME